MTPFTPSNDHSDRAGAARAPQVRWVLASLSIPALMSSLDTSIANVALPTLAHAFGATFHDVQWVVLAYLLALTTLIVGAGRLGDVLGRRRVMLAGLAVFTVASAACGAATTLPVLIAARAAQGLGAASMMALSLAFVGDAVPRERSGRAVGLLGAMSAVGTALGPPLGGLLVATVGWRSVFFVSVPIGLLGMALVASRLPADRPGPKADRAAFDHAGTALLAATLGAYALAMTSAQSHPGIVTGALLAAAALAGAIFARVESRAALPLIRPAVLREGALGASLGTSALVSAVVMSTLVVGPFYLTHALGLDAARVGLLMSVGPLVVVLSGVPAGRAVDRLGTRRTTNAGLAAIATGSLLLASLPASLGVIGYLLPIVVLTGGYALFQTANNTAVMTGMSYGERGAVSGLLGLSRNLGLITGAAVLGTVFSVASGSSHVTAAHPGAVAFGMRTTFAVATTLAVGALALANARRAREPQSPARTP